LSGVGLDYPTRPGVLRDVHLAIPPGAVAVLEGRSGSGKSSLLAVAAGLEAPTQGLVQVLGETMDPRDADQRSGLRSRHIGLVFQHLHLLSELSVEENIGLPLRLRRAAKPERLQRTRELLDAFGIAPLRDRRPAGLSGGEQQRVAIARALAVRPALLLVDEPTSSLDAENALTVLDALRSAAREGASVLVATHDEVLHKAGRLFAIEGGRVRRPA
jgi:ABC-type lipoprotein export system ATPase subunit